MHGENLKLKYFTLSGSDRFRLVAILMELTTKQLNLLL